MDLKSMNLKKKKRITNSLATEGRTSFFLGKNLLKSIEYLSQTEKISLSELLRIATFNLIEHYKKYGKIPFPPKENTQKRKVGRPRVYHEIPIKEI